MLTLASDPMSTVELVRVCFGFALAQLALKLVIYTVLPVHLVYAWEWVRETFRGHPVPLPQAASLAQVRSFRKARLLLGVLIIGPLWTGAVAWGHWRSAFPIQPELWILICATRGIIWTGLASSQLRLSGERLIVLGIGGVLCDMLADGCFGAIVHGEYLIACLVGLVVLTLLASVQRLSSSQARRPGFGTSVCAACGYNLTGNTTGICPECGTPVPPPMVK